MNLSFYEITVTFEIYTSQLVIYKILVKRTQLWNIYEVNFICLKVQVIYRRIYHILGHQNIRWRPFHNIFYGEGGYKVTFTSMMMKWGKSEKKRHLARWNLPAGSERIEWSGVYFFAFCGVRTEEGCSGGWLEILLKFKMCKICRLI